MNLPEFVTVKALLYADGIVVETEIPVSSEYHLVLKINGNPFVSIACSGSDMKNLAVGHLISEGIVYTPDEIIEIIFDEKKLEIDVILKTNDEILERLFRIRSIASGCGQGPGITVPGYIRSITQSHEKTIEPSGILSCMYEFLHASDHHQLTRGVHSAALFDSGWKQLFFSDEIGRHNAIDKIIGYAFVNGIPLNDKLILSTGRLSSEIISKGLTSGILGIISKSAPTSHSIELAKKHDLLLIGKVSRSQFTIFSGRDKLKMK